MAAALCSCRSPALLLRRQLLLRLLSTQSPPPQTLESPAEVSRLKSSIRNAATSPDDLASLFLSGLPHPVFLADRPIFSLSVRRLASDGRRDLVASILSSSLTALPAPHPSEGFIIRLISLYSAAGMPDHSLTTFRLVNPPSDRALSALLSAYHDNRLYDRAVQAFNTLPAELGIKPSVVSYNVLLKSLVAAGDVAAARAMFDEMPDKAGIKPDIVSCNELLRGYLNAGDHAAFDEFLKGVFTLKPSVATYNLRMAALCAKGRSFEAEELLDAMQAKRVLLPNRDSFNTVIKGLCKEGEVGAAMALFRKMAEVPPRQQNGATGVSPNFETYIMLLEALVSKGVFGPALEVCKECLQNKWAPPFQAVKALVQGLLKSRKAKQAKEVLMSMRKAVKGDAKEQWLKVEAEFPLLLADKKA